MTNKSDLVIGIDLGTTNSCVAYYKNNRIIVLENREGDRTTPSTVFFKKDNEIIVDRQTKRLIENSPKSGIYDVKRLLGKTYNDPSIQNLKDLVPYGIKDKNGDIELEISLSMSKGVVKKTPEQISSCILRKIKHDVDEKLGYKISNAVITIPAYFNVRQREATLKAGQLAGFNVLKLLTEPTAAALCYFHEVTHCPNNKYYLVYDLGGGTFDVSILKKTQNEINVIGIDGDVNLGGYDFDCMILQYVDDFIKEKYNFDITKSNKGKFIRRVQNVCEEAKRELSNQEETSIVIARPKGLVSNNDDDDNENDIIIDFSRKKFEEICFDLFKKTITIVENCLKNANLTKNDIEEVILCGGSTRIPKIQELLTTFFNGKKLQKTNNLDESVAEGAALQAAVLSKCEIQNTVKLNITDVVSLSIGVNDFVGRTNFLIKRNTPLPSSGECNRRTIYNNQAKVTFKIYEGERLNSSKNYYLGSFALNNLTPAPPGDCKVNLKIMLDINGILTCTATERVSNNTNVLQIDYNKRHTSTINCNAIDAREDIAADEVFRKFANCKAFIINYCIKFNYNVKEMNLMNIYEDIYEYCNNIQKSVQTMTEDDYKQLIIIEVELLEKCENIVIKYNFKLMPNITM